MALIKEVKCERCDRRYSAIRTKCPHCGARKNKDGKDASEGGSKLPIIIYAIVLIAVVAAVVILVCSAIRGKNGELSGAKNTPPVHTSGSGVSSVEGTDPTPSQKPENPNTGTGETVVTPSPEPTPETTPEPDTTVNSITLSLTDFTLSKVGEQWTIVATISPAGSEAELKWISEDPGVATVDENGMVTAVNKGTTTVSATAGGVIAECIVRVTASASTSSGQDSGSVGTSRLSHTDVTIDSASSERFTLTVKDAPAGAEVSYSVDKSDVATVDASGHVQAVAKGTAYVTVTVTSPNGTETLKCIVRVR